MTSERSPRWRSHLRSPRIVLEDSEASVFTDFGSLSSSGASTEEPSRQPTLSLPVCSFALKISRGMMYHYFFYSFLQPRRRRGWWRRRRRTRKGTGYEEDEEDEERAEGSGKGGPNSWSMPSRAKTLPLPEDLLEGAPTEPKAARRRRGREEEGKTIRRGNRERKGEIARDEEFEGDGGRGGGGRGEGRRGRGS